MIFSRRREGSSGHSRDERSNRPDNEARSAAPADGSTAEFGPYDISQAPPGVQRLDLGSLHIPAVPDVEVRVQANPDGVIQQVVLIHGDSALQLGVFAAPRSEGIWAEVREEIQSSLTGEGALVQEVPGYYGPELRARVRTPDGDTDLRFVGVDGPRWMVRGVYQGPAAADPALAGPLTACLEGLVVDRGAEAKPVREPLALRLPREVAEQAEQAEQAGQPPEPVPARPAPVNGVVSGQQRPNRGHLSSGPDGRG